MGLTLGEGNIFASFFSLCVGVLCSSKEPLHAGYKCIAFQKVLNVIYPQICCVRLYIYNSVSLCLCVCLCTALHVCLSVTTS